MNSRLVPCAFSLPAIPTNLLSNIRQTTAAALAAIALTITPPQNPPSPTVHRAQTQHQRTHSYRTHRLKYATAPVVVFDKDYATRLPSIWQFDTEAPTPQPQPPPPKSSIPLDRALARPPALPPGPLLASEVRILTRLLVALVVGGVIGMERRAANSLAGVRTFSLVSLGAAIFMSTTLVAFPHADPTRVAAAISSGVGFLGAGAIHKGTGHSRGLTTASSVWLAAALGIAAACGMFLLSFMGAISTVLIARYARFDSSLHLIRGDPLGDDVDEDEDVHDHEYASENGQTQFSQQRLRYPDHNGFEFDRSGGVSNDGRFGGDLYELKSFVDFDPSSQGYSDRGHGTGNGSGGNDTSRSSQNGTSDGNQVEER